MKLAVAAAALLMVLAAPLTAQEPPRTSHVRAAAELVEVLRLEEQTRANMNTMIGGMADDGEAGAKLAGVMTAFLEEFMPWSVLEPEFVTLYEENFTEEELRELIAFHRTPVGRKVVERTPHIMQQAHAVVQRLLTPHQAELQRRLMSAFLDGGQ